jgi:hypothetical protein
MLGISLQKSGAIAAPLPGVERGEKWCVAGLARSAILANTAITGRGDRPCGHRARRKARRTCSDAQTSFPLRAGCVALLATVASLLPLTAFAALATRRPLATPARVGIARAVRSVPPRTVANAHVLALTRRV